MSRRRLASSVGGTWKYSKVLSRVRKAIRRLTSYVMGETAVRNGHRWEVHHCRLDILDCECDPMPRYEDATDIAIELGLTLREPDWTGSTSYTYQEDALQRYKALLAAMSNRAVLEALRECALTSAQSQRAWKALRLGEAVDVWESVKGKGGDKDTVRTRIRLLRVAENVERVVATTNINIFISDSADSQNSDAVEKWKMANELTIGVVYTQTKTEVIVAVEETPISSITYDERSRMLLRCVGQVGQGLELLIAVGLIARDISHNSSSHLWVREFEEVGNILASSIGVAAMSDFKAADSRVKVKPSGASVWMPKEMFEVMLTLLPVREGFVDLRACGMQSTVRLVSSAHARLLCPHCWVTGELNSHSPAVQIQPLRLVGSSDKHNGYTAVSHLWSTFSENDTVCSMQNGAAIVGGPTSLWIDKLCINQDDNDEKATELSRMGSYYAGAHTTLICPARRVVGVPLTKPSRHLVAVPGHLSDYQGLSA